MWGEATVLKMLAKDGQQVRPGQKIATLDVPTGKPAKHTRAFRTSAVTAELGRGGAATRPSQHIAHPIGRR